MTDIDTVREMLKRASVVYTHHNTGREATCVDHEAVVQSIEVGQWGGPGPSPTNHGYVGFVTYMFFDADGKLVCMGAWE